VRIWSSTAISPRLPSASPSAAGVDAVQRRLAAHRDEHVVGLDRLGAPSFSTETRTTSPSRSAPVTWTPVLSTSPCLE
jgi:hypothetical protein